MDRKTAFWGIIAALFFLPFLGGLHLFDWDEINFAEIAREMIVTGNWLKMQMNYEVFTEKPPLFFWLQALSMSVFGVGEYAARFPNAVLGIVVLPYLYRLGTFIIDKKFGMLWALSWLGSILPFLYFKSGIIDPFFNFFIFNGLVFLIFARWKEKGIRELRWSKSKLIAVGGAFIGLGILTKGPVAYLLIFLTFLAFTLINGRRFAVKLPSFICFSLSALGVFLIWFAVDLIARGPDFLIEFTIRQWELLTTGDAGHSGFLGYHFVVLLFGCFPASIFAISSLRKRRGLADHVVDFQKWMIYLFWVVLILFSLVGTKIIHYSSMAYYPVTFLSALTLWRWLEQKTTAKWGWLLGIGSIGSIIVLISFILPYVGMHVDIILPLMEADPFATKNMEADVPWSTIDYLPGILYLMVIIATFIFWKKKREGSIRTLFYGTAIWVFCGLIFFSGKIERISQRANVVFFEEQVNEEVYVTTWGYKSYVPWFYARVQPYSNPNATDKNWLLQGEVDRPVRISVKVHKVEDFKAEVPDAVLMYEENGFYFFERPAFNR